MERRARQNHSQVVILTSDGGSRGPQGRAGMGGGSRNERWWWREG